MSPWKRNKCPRRDAVEGEGAVSGRQTEALPGRYRPNDELLAFLKLTQGAK